MKKKMETEEGKRIYNLRKIVVEPVIGNIKYNLGFDEFLVRGLDGAKLELNIASIAHNLKKIWILRGKISKNNNALFFELIICKDYLNSDTACLGQGSLQHIAGPPAQGGTLYKLVNEPRKLSRSILLFDYGCDSTLDVVCDSREGKNTAEGVCYWRGDEQLVPYTLLFNEVKKFDAERLAITYRAAVQEYGKFHR